MKWLNSLADIATIVTASVAVLAYGTYRVTLYRRTKSLEKILETKNRPNDDSLTLEQLAAASVMTSDQVIEAASRSKKIEPWGGQSGNEYRFRIKR